MRALVDAVVTTTREASSSSAKDDAIRHRTPLSPRRPADLISALPFYGAAAGLVFSGALLDGLRLAPEPVRSAAVGLAGVVVGALAGEIGRRRLRGASLGPRIFSSLRPGLAGAAPLQVVGASPSLLAHAVCEVAAPFIARGERVLVLDVSRAGSSERQLVAPARWGLGECLAGLLPLLGAVQSGGVAGLHVVPRGAAFAPNRAARASCAPLLDQATRHFARVILAVDGASPWLEGAAGRRLDAWWFGSAGEKTGQVQRIPSNPIEWLCLRLTPSSRKPLEVLRQRVEAYRGATRLAASRRATSSSRLRTPRRAAEPNRTPAAAPRAAADRDGFQPERREPVLISGDSRTRERLRFLVWMRGVGRNSGADAGSAGRR